MMKKMLILVAVIAYCTLNFFPAHATSTWKVQCKNTTSTPLNIELVSCDPDMKFNLPANTTVTKSISNNCGGVHLYYQEVGKTGWHDAGIKEQRHDWRWTYKTCTPTPITCPFGVGYDWSTY